PSSYIEELRAAGCECLIFLPPWVVLLEKRVNYRNHRKIVVVDGVTGFLGGINIGDEYSGGNPELGSWRDTHLRLDGPVVDELQYIFLADWQAVSGKPVVDDPAYYRWESSESESESSESSKSSESSESSASLNSSKGTRSPNSLRAFESAGDEVEAVDDAVGDVVDDIREDVELKLPGDEQVMLMASGPHMVGKSVIEVYTTLFHAAKERIWITTPYFIPSEPLISALKTAAM